MRQTYIAQTARCQGNWRTVMSPEGLRQLDELLRTKVAVRMAQYCFTGTYRTTAVVIRAITSACGFNGCNPAYIEAVYTEANVSATQPFNNGFEVITHSGLLEKAVESWQEHSEWQVTNQCIAVCQKHEESPRILLPAYHLDVFRLVAGFEMCVDRARRDAPAQRDSGQLPADHRMYLETLSSRLNGFTASIQSRIAKMGRDKRITESPFTTAFHDYLD